MTSWTGIGEYVKLSSEIDGHQKWIEGQRIPYSYQQVIKTYEGIIFVSSLVIGISYDNYFFEYMIYSINNQLSNFCVLKNFHGRTWWSRSS